jgi:REP element-mobilizing transposase RayT
MGFEKRLLFMRLFRYLLPLVLNETMPNTYHQIYIHLVFAVKGRENQIKQTFRGDLFKVMSSMISELGHKSIIVNGMGDHVHCLVGLNPDIKLSDLVRDLKTKSNHFLKDKNWVSGKFAWQNGYGAFSYSRSQLDRIYKYVLNQDEHHRKMTFKDEYVGFLKKYDIEFKDEYLFEFYED